MLNSDTDVYTLTLNVGAGASGTLINTASVTSPTTDPDSGNNSDDQSSNVGASADLSLTKTGSASVTAGGQAVYTISVTNLGLGAAENVTVTDSSS